MATLPPPGVIKFPDDSLERQVYDLVESLKDHLPIMNDRNRLGFNLYKYMTGEGDHPDVLVKSSKLKVEGISLEELASKIAAGLESIKGNS